MAMYDTKEFYQSFTMDDSDNYMDFFNTNGFVVIRDVVSEDDCDQTLDEFWSKNSGLVDKSDPATWNDFWSSQEFAKFSIIGSGASMTHSQLSNRQNPFVYDVFRRIHQTDKLWVDHDRIGVMRPTIHIKFGDEYLDMPEWKTIDRWLHIDCNPFTGRTDVAGFDHFNDVEVNFEKKLFVQGLIALTDAKIDDGGFHCVPKSHLDPNIYKQMPNPQEIFKFLQIIRLEISFKKFQ